MALGIGAVTVAGQGGSGSKAQQGAKKGANQLKARVQVNFLKYTLESILPDQCFPFDQRIPYPSVNLLQLCLVLQRRECVCCCCRAQPSRPAKVSRPSRPRRACPLSGRRPAPSAPRPGRWRQLPTQLLAQHVCPSPALSPAAACLAHRRCKVEVSLHQRRHIMRSQQAHTQGAGLTTSVLIFILHSAYGLACAPAVHASMCSQDPLLLSAFFPLLTRADSRLPGF